MILKTSTISIQDDNLKKLNDSSENYQTHDDFITNKNITNKNSKTVHRRRDLDSLG